MVAATQRFTENGRPTIMRLPVFSTAAAVIVAAVTSRSRGHGGRPEDRGRRRGRRQGGGGGGGGDRPGRTTATTTAAAHPANAPAWRYTGGARRAAQHDVRLAPAEAAACPCSTAA